MSSEKENEQQKIFFVQKKENNEFVFMNYNMQEELKEKANEENVKIEIIKQTNDNNQSSDEVYLEKKVENQIIMKGDILLGKNNTRSINYFFIPKTENCESIIINSNVEEVLQEKLDDHDDNIEQQGSIKIEIIEQIYDNSETSDEIHLEDGMDKQIIPKEDISLEESNIQPIDYLFVLKTEKSITINSNMEGELKEKYDEHKDNVQHQKSIKTEIIYNPKSSDKVHLQEETEPEPDKKINVEKKTNETLKRQSTRNVKSKFRKLLKVKNSLKADTDNITTSTSSCELDSDFRMHSGKKIYIRTHTAKKSYVCNICDKKFATSSYLKYHLRNHSDEKKHACVHCDKKFLSHKSLDRHIRIHAGEKPYVCDHCIKRFAQHNDLVRHNRIHTGEKPYVCDRCNKSFNRQSNLVRHVRTHTGEKPFDCNVCDKKFSDLSSLKYHLRNHSDAEKYTCDHCNKRFAQHIDLVRHIRIHTGEKPYVCDRCSKRFNHHSHLVRHFRTHIGKKSFVCNQCNRRFNQQMHLDKHIQSHAEDGSMK